MMQVSLTAQIVSSTIRCGALTTLAVSFFTAPAARSAVIFTGPPVPNPPVVAIIAGGGAAGVFPIAGLVPEAVALANGFKVTNAEIFYRSVAADAGAPVVLEVTTTRPFIDPGGLFINISILSGEIDVPPGATIDEVLVETEHVNEAGASSAFARDNNGGKKFGAGKKQPIAGFGAQIFLSAAGADILRQRTRITLTPVGAGQDFFIRFPGSADSLTNPVPEPTSLMMMFTAGMLGLISRRARMHFRGISRPAE
jgi:hypothetical protein